MFNSANNTIKCSRKMEDSEKSVSKSRRRTTGKQDGCVLIDITNDSPIVGLASGSLNGTPISTVSKQRSHFCKKTPGSGEALLRGQVKNLLQKVEEEADISKFLIENCGPLRNGFKAIFNSPAALAAPTPVNTPQVLNFSTVQDFQSFTSLSQPPISVEVISGSIDVKQQSENGSEYEEDMMISRTLFLDFSEKSDSSSDCSSVMTYQGTNGVDKEGQEKVVATDDDDASIWSIQVNASTRDEDEDEDEVNQDAVDEDVVDDNDEYYDEEGVEEADDMLFLDELCEGISNINVDGEKKGPKFMGKHIKFVYNSDDELVEEYEESNSAEGKKDDSADILHLKGLPTPKGKHVRFEDED